MPFNDVYRRQAALLVRILPFVASERCFALKGGTAINLFVRNMPRLSVDIDLTYVPVKPRSESLAEIDAALKRIASIASSGSPAEDIREQRRHDLNAVTGLIARGDGVQIKVEVTPVLRGCVYEPEIRAVSPAVEASIGYAEIQVVSFADLYAGKLVAALDRQHPRDLFDVRDLLANEGIDERLRRAFLVYLISHNRPMAEVVAPARRDFSAEYLRVFSGMTEAPVPLEELIEARERLIAEIVGKMPPEHRRFLISFERGEAEWDLLNLPGVDRLPAVRWRVENLAQINSRKRARLVDQLAAALQIDV